MNTFLSAENNSYNIDKTTKRFWFLWLFLLISSIILQQVGVFHLSEEYHSFADHRELLGVHSFWNVVSNISFIGIGFYMFYKYRNNKENNINLWITVIGSILVFLGSSYYHYSPDNNALLWDRLPMALVFSGIFMYSVIKLNLLNFVSLKNKFSIGYGIFSILCVVLWYIGTIIDVNLIGAYVFLQFGGMVLLGLMAHIAHRRNEKILYNKIISLLFIYVVAKLFEHYDQQIFTVTYEIISGHSIKHLVSALALYVWLKPKKNENKIKFIC